MLTEKEIRIKIEKLYRSNLFSGLDLLQILKVFAGIKRSTRLIYEKDKSTEERKFLLDQLEIPYKHITSTVFAGIKDRNKGSWSNLCSKSKKAISIALYIGLHSKDVEKSIKAEECGDDGEFGDVLSYPACCNKFFFDNFGDAANIQGDLFPFVYKNTDDNFSPLPHLLNPLWYFDAGFIEYWPCSFRCIHALEEANIGRNLLKKYLPEIANEMEKKFTKLILKNIFAPDELSMKVEDFKRQLGGLLCHILNGLNKEDAENIAEESLHNDVSLGIYPMSRAYVFCTLIQQNYGIKAAVSLQRMPLVDFIPENDLEYKILSLKNNEIMIACIEDGRLSRPDVFLTPEFQKLNIRTAMMLAFMGVPLQMRKNLVKWLQEHNADAETIEFFDGEYRLAATIQTREENEERLIKAVFEQDEFIVDVLSDKVSLSEISDDEVLAAWKLSRTVREKFFKKALYCRPQVMLLAKLLEQNNKINGVRMEYEELADEPADLINILIQALLI